VTRDENARGDFTPRRGEVYDARLDPGTEGSEQAGTRPVIIVSRDSINIASTVVLAVPCTTRHIYPTHVLLHAPEDGLTADSIALGEQVRPLAKGRLLRRRGLLSAGTLVQIERALLIALGLPSAT